MFEIVDKKVLAPGRYMMKIMAPDIARTSLPGQFVILIVDENGERIPLTICDKDLDKGGDYSRI